MHHNGALSKTVVEEVEIEFQPVKTRNFEAQSSSMIEKQQKNPLKKSNRAAFSPSFKV